MWSHLGFVAELPISLKTATNLNILNRQYTGIKMSDLELKNTWSNCIEDNHNYEYDRRKRNKHTPVNG
jgi:hypothetical protein